MRRLLSLLMLTLCLCAIGVTASLNYRAGCAASFEAGVVLLIAAVAPMVVGAWAKLHGRPWAARIAVALCLLASAWAELEAWASGKETQSAFAEASVEARSGAVSDLADARRRLAQIPELLDRKSLERLVNDSEAAVKAAEGTFAKQQATATEAGVDCLRRNACKDALKGVQTAKEALGRLVERLGVAREKERLLGLLERKKGEAVAKVEVAAMPNMIARTTGWPLPAVERTLIAAWAAVLVLINTTLSHLSSHALAGLLRERMTLAAEAAPPTPVRVETAAAQPMLLARRPPTDDELLGLYNEGLTMRQIADRFAGVESCSKSTLNLRLLKLRR